MKLPRSIESDEMIRWSFPVGFGKIIWAASTVTPVNSAAKKGGLLYVFQRCEIEAQNYARFVGWIRTHAEKSRLEEIRGHIVFAIDGWEEDPRELLEIPEVRRYFSTLTQSGPAWFFLSDLSIPENLRMIAACSVDQVEIIKKKVWNHVDVVCSEVVIREFSESAMHGHAVLSDLAAIQPSESLMQLADALEVLLQEDCGS